MNRLINVSLTLAVMVLLQASSAFGQFKTLIRHVPEEANTLVLFDVEGIMATPLAQKEGWRERHENLSSSGLILVPPDANQFVLASQMDVELMVPRWSATVMNLSYEPSMMKVVQKYGGNVDEIDGQEAAVLPNDTYVVKFGKVLAGTMFPADRQKATRWVKNAYSSSSPEPLGEYLSEAEGFAEKNGTPIILAINLEHVFSPSFIRHRLDSVESLKGKNVDLDQLAKVMASIRGATLGITITDHMFGGLKVDFSEDVSMAKEFAKPLLLEVLANHGAMIQEFKDWKMQVSGKHMLLRGPLYKSGIQRICTVLDSPADLRPVATPNLKDGETNESLVARTTLQYYKMLGQLLDDIVDKRKETRTQTAGLVAMWYKQYASKIDAMPILNVDPEMVQFGSQVAGALRQAQGSMQGVGVQQASGMANMQGANVVDYAYAGGGGERYGFYGGGYAYRYQSNPRASLRADGAEIARIKTNARIQGYGAANQTMQGVTVAMADMRKKMTLKYKIEF
jgi:hypothetical protein